jgi:hypothetical protein
LESAIRKLEAERAEVDDVLSSGVLGRTNNLVRFMTYVCEKYFAGAIDDVKEYNIAVHALGRREAFDPQVDTIVRVTAHGLRKRLEDYYRSAGAEHAVHICLPPGRYVPKFVHSDGSETKPCESRLEEIQNGPSLETHSPQGNGRTLDLHDSPGPGIHESKLESALESLIGGESKQKFLRGSRILAGAAVFVISVLALSLFAWKKWNRRGGQEASPRVQAAAAPGNISGGILRIAMGDDSSAYVDRGGLSWATDHSCTGGRSFSVAGHTIQGTEDPALFSTGRRGIFHCNYPVPPGTYEVHLQFAETEGLQENSRNVVFSVNGRASNSLDVVDDAGGDDIATTKVVTDVAPTSDGTIRLDFSTPESFVNAVEILPSTPHHLLPVRIVVGHSPYRDSNGNVWVSDRYFIGGRVSSFARDLSKIADGRLYEWHRFGHFRYVVPVTTGRTYTLRFYFMEHWFGLQNGAIGGVGSRVFDVSCNGAMLLKGFDILREAGSEPLVKSFPHIEPTPQGKIEIYFTPNVNYPSVSAIEVLPE